MRNQFFYTVLGSEGTETPKMGSFNVDYVIRSINYAENRIVILLDDFHEVKEQHTVPVGKNGKTVTRIDEDIVCSEIFLNEEDSQRYMNLCSISTPNSYRGLSSGSKPTITSTEQEAIPTLA